MSRLRPEAAPSLIHVPSLASAGGEFELGPEESHYVARVCRAAAGASLGATDGLGSRARLEVIALQPRVRVRVLDVVLETRTRGATIACGAPEGSRADWLIEKLAELGVAKFVPLETARGRWPLNASRRERWERLSLAALRQSRQSWRMEIGAPLEIEALLAGSGLPASRWVADPEGDPSARAPLMGDALGAIGPSGGFDSGERVRLKDAGFAAISLGTGRLRAETAALCWAAWWARAGV